MKVEKGLYLEKLDEETRIEINFNNMTYTLISHLLPISNYWVMKIWKTENGWDVQMKDQFHRGGDDEVHFVVRDFEVQEDFVRLDFQEKYESESVDEKLERLRKETVRSPLQSRDLSAVLNVFWHSFLADQ